MPQDADKPTSAKPAADGPARGAAASSPSNGGSAAPAPAANGSAAGKGKSPRVGPRSPSPPKRRDSLAGWLLTGLCVLLAGLPLMIEAHRPDVTHEREATAVVITRETWRSHQDEDGGFATLAYYPPVLDGRPVLSRPPGLTWMQVLACRVSLDPDAASTAQIVRAARAISVGMGLLLVASLVWAAYAVGGLRTAPLAAGLLIAQPLLILALRRADATSSVAAFAALATAASLWSIRPLRPMPALGRQGIGWAICGVATGLALLTGGLPAGLLTIIPIFVLSFLVPHRLSHLLGLASALIIAALMVTPWMLTVQEIDPHAWQAWLADLVPGGWLGAGEQVGVFWQRLVWIGVLVVPWTMWLIAGLIQPFSTSAAGVRQRMFVGWTWFVTVATLLLLRPGTLQPGVLALMAPAASLMIAQLFRVLMECSAEGRHVRAWRILRWPHGLGMLAASLALPALLAWQRPLVDAGYLASPLTGPMPNWAWLGLAIALVVIAGFAMRFALQNYPAKSLLLWSAWMIAASTVCLIPFSRGPQMQNETRLEAVKLGHRTAGQTLYYLQPERGGPLPMHVQLYAERAIPSISEEQLGAITSAGQPLHALVPGGNPAPMHMDLVEAYGTLGMKLYRRQPTADPAATMPANGEAE